MPHPKKTIHYQWFVITDTKTGNYFYNKSNHASRSARHCFNRANNPQRKDYNCPFYTDLRERPDDFKVEFFEVDEYVRPENTVRAHYYTADGLLVKRDGCVEMEEAENE